MKASWLRRGHLTLKSSRPSSNASPIWKLFFGECLLAILCAHRLLTSWLTFSHICRASDRQPFRGFCQVLSQVAPGLNALIVRPIGLIENHTTILQHQLAGPAEHHCEGHLRWEAPRLSSLHCLRVLSLSKLSSDGVNQLHMVLQFAPMLEKMTIESLFIDDALLAHVGKLRYLTNLTLRSSGTKVI